MVRVSSGELGVLKLFKQLVPTSNGRHENDLEINTLRPDSVRFKLKICPATWFVDHDWDKIEFAFSYTGKLETEQKPWRRESYTRIGPMFWRYEQKNSNCTQCGGAQGRNILYV